MIRIAGHEFALELVKHEFLSALILNDPGDVYRTVRQIRSIARGSLYLEFFDLSEERKTHRGPIAEDVVHAIEWYKKIQRATWNDVVVTCTAGISRSAAMAFVLECVDKTPQEASQVWNPRLHYPNKLIVRLGAEILSKPDMIKVCDEFWDERLRRRASKGKPAKVDV
jgi:predicted protein tyrosine phosphatase